MATQKDVKNRINSVKNIRKITRAMEMVAAARLRRAEQRIAEMRPYAQSLRRVTQRVAEAAGQDGTRVKLLQQRDERQAGRDHPDHRRPRPRRVVQHPDHPRRHPAAARDRGWRRSGLLLRGRPARQLGAQLPRRERRRFLHRLHRSAGVRERAQRRQPPRRLLRRRGDRPGRADLQPLRLAADPVRAAPHAAPAPGRGGLRRGHPRARAAGRSRARRGAPALRVDLRARSRGGADACSSRSTSTSRSTGRCSSRRRPSTAPG